MMMSAICGVLNNDHDHNSAGDCKSLVIRLLLSVCVLYPHAFTHFIWKAEGMMLK